MKTFKFQLDSYGIIGCFYLFVVINSFITWFSFGNILRVLVFFLVLYKTIELASKQKVGFGKKIKTFIYFNILFTVYYILVNDLNFNGVIAKFIQLLPMIMIISWPKEKTQLIYKYFFAIVIFYSVGSVFVSILSAVGLLSHFPYYTLPPQSAAHLRWGYDFHVYGCFVTLNGFNNSIIPRVCGFMQEPGHFSIFLGLTYVIERMLRHNPNILLIICGLFTFSFNFILMAVIAELYYSYKNTRMNNLFKKIAICALASISIYAILPKNLQEDVNYLFLDRNMSSLIDSYVESGSLDEALNERINSTGEFYYNRFIESGNILFGENIKDDMVILSDYRGIIFNLGIIGFIFVILLIYNSTNRLKFIDRLPLVTSLFLVLLHRSFMFNSPYLFFFSFIGTTVCFCNNTHTQ